MAEAVTIARPYAVAVFRLAKEKNALVKWSDMLALLAAVVADPQMRTLIDGQLRYGLQYRLESQIVAGAGSGEDLKGIVNQSGILTQAKSTGFPILHQQQYHEAMLRES